MLIQLADGGLEDLKIECNTSNEKLFENVRVNADRGLPEVEMSPPRVHKNGEHQVLVICGGGPSLADDESIDTILKLQSAGADVMALNNSGQLLAENGIRADYQVVLDARPDNAQFVQFNRADELLLASQCHPGVFETALARGAKVRLWHAVTDEIQKHIKNPKPILVGGGTTVGLTAMCLAYCMGYTRMHLFGYDSSHRNGKGHAYRQDMNLTDQVMRVAVDGEVFYSSTTMAAQARKFPDVATKLADLGCEIEVHGDGLIPHIAKMMMRLAEEKPLVAVYDLGSAPPTYDFITFLAAAEDYRKGNGYTHIDVVFQPGPINGFRDDNLPPDAEERRAMLWRVCMGATRLLPSVRNVTLLREREDVKADFPPGYTAEMPVPCYGPRFFTDAQPVLRATDAAKRLAKKITGDAPYIVIPVRQADYWPHRNTDLKAWQRAVEFVREFGWNVFWIPDTNGEDVPGERNVRAAALDIDLRLAIYEGAELVTGLIGGAGCLAVFSSAKYAFIHPIDESKPTTDREYLKRLGIEMEKPWTPRGRVVFGRDDEAAAKKLLWEHFYGEATEQEACAIAHAD